MVPSRSRYQPIRRWSYRRSTRMGWPCAVVDGFGARTQEKILAGIELVKKFSERHLLGDATEAAEALHNEVRNFSGVIRSQITKQKADGESEEKGDQQQRW